MQQLRSELSHVQRFFEVCTNALRLKKMIRPAAAVVVISKAHEVVRKQRLSLILSETSDSTSSVKTTAEVTIKRILHVT